MTAVNRPRNRSPVFPRDPDAGRRLGAQRTAAATFQGPRRIRCVFSGGCSSSGWGVVLGQTNMGPGPSDGDDHVFDVQKSGDVVDLHPLPGEVHLDSVDPIQTA